MHVCVRASKLGDDLILGSVQLDRKLGKVVVREKTSCNEIPVGSTSNITTRTQPYLNDIDAGYRLRCRSGDPPDVPQLRTAS